MYNNNRYKSLLFFSENARTGIRLTFVENYTTTLIVSTRLLFRATQFLNVKTKLKRFRTYNYKRFKRNLKL